MERTSRLRMQGISVRLSPRLLSRLDELAEREQTTRSGAIRLLLRRVRGR